jgi:hypothetical protein
MSGDNEATITAEGDDPSRTITITVTDGSGRCPQEYRDAMPQADNPKGFWAGGPDGDTYTKIMD